MNPWKSTFLHHIKLEDLKDAPTFEEFAPIALVKLSDSIAVAHNAAFEDKFLGAEFGKGGMGGSFLTNAYFIDKEGNKTLITKTWLKEEGALNVETVNGIGE